MPSFTENLNLIVALGTIAGQALVLFLVMCWIQARFGSGAFKEKAQNVLRQFREHSLSFALLVALSATLTSLIYSNIIGYPPCTLCWIQRIFLYPQVIILGLALWKKTRDADIYCGALSLLGVAVALYHYYGEMFNPGLLDACTAQGGVSCAVRYVVEFGYITIPLMSVTAFLLIIASLLLTRPK